ncbi:LysR family transcriptional regulator [Rhizobium tumorigenes]|uniref:LysR family transcriptional regulator n=1 Tax=Rhizobium tumorigenes TaxID=2041385 RepID=UPI00241FD128|nr:LysR family transcriptional regulator [Rhizobium tumorigenes]WFR99643.1 LysR family transcriptional regulator [Rhizobium tumorigenes]
MNRNEPSWDLYRSFLAVLQHGSLSAAARELGLTQPTIGRHIDTLEQTIGAELFTRSQLGLLPTDAAADLRPYAEALQSTAAALLRSASARRDRVSGTVRISASEVIGVEVLPPILADLQEAHPDLTIELSASDTVEDLLHRQADIAVRMAEPSQAALVVRRIGDIPIAFFAHRHYLERHGVPTTLEELAGHRLIGFDRQSAYIRSMIRRYPILDPQRFSFKADSTLAQIAAIRAGVGIGLCQSPLGNANPDLVRLLPEVSLPLGTWVAMHENLKGSPRCRVTFDALVAGLLAYVGEKRVDNRRSST